MEQLLTFEAEAKYLLAPGNRSFEQKAMQELLGIFKEAEQLFGPRDKSFELSLPRLTECTTSRSFVFRPPGVTRIYLSRDAKTTPWRASVELAHEAIHVLSPVALGSTITVLEEGLAEWFGQRYASRVHGMVFERGSNPKADAIMQSVSKLLAKNQFVIRDLRKRQSVISKIDEKLLIEVAGIERSHAKFLCTNFQSYWGSDRHPE